MCSLFYQGVLSITKKNSKHSHRALLLIDKHIRRQKTHVRNHYFAILEWAQGAVIEEPNDFKNLSSEEKN